MKKKLLLLGAVLTSATYIQAQSLQVDARTVINDLPAATMGKHVNANKTASCGPDTVAYPLAKATGLAVVGINNATSATSLSQYYNCPQPLTISGADFYGFKSDETGGIIANVDVAVYLAGPDSLPTGAPVVSTTLQIDTVFADGQLTQLIKHADFAPTSVSQPYCVVISNNTPNGVSLVTSSYTNADGAGEWLGAGLIGTTWLQGYNIVLGGTAFDADILIHPYVTYDLTASFTQATDCIGDNGNGVWTNTSSPVLGDRMYNYAAFLELENLSYTWNYGDGSAEENVIDGAHTYASTAPWTVTLTDTLYGWGVANCIDAATLATGDPAQASFTTTTNGLVASFTSTSTGTNITDHTWDFGDGESDNDANPTHTYAFGGTYTVCVTAFNACGASAQVCSPVTVSVITGMADLIQQNLAVYPNPSEGSVTLELNGIESAASLNIFDVAGRNVFSEQLVIGNEFKKNINLQDVNAGTYLLQLVTEEGVATKKLQIH